LPPHYRICDLIDIPRLQNLLDSLYQTAGIPSAVIDLDGNILTGSGWQDICTRFHRVDARTAKGCRESDRNIALGLSLSRGHAQITCPRGLVDAAVPLVIEGMHVANIFTGQFFLAPPDREWFRQQAGEFGFNEEAYLAALDRVPLVSQAKLDRYLAFLSNLAGSLAAQGLQKLRSLEAQEALQESEERFQQLFDNMSDGVAVYRAVDEGRDFVFVDINKPGQSLSRIRLAEAVGRRVTELFPAVREMGLLEVLRRVWQTGQPEQLPLTLYRDGNLSQWVENYVYRLPSGLVVAIYSDSSAKHKAEEENARLQNQLNQAQKMEAIGVLAGGIAHDFNNILGPIIGYAEMAREEAAPGSQLVQDLGQILTAAHRAKDLVKQILAFSRQSTADRIPLKIQPLLKESLKMLRASIPATITIRENIHPRCGTVLACPTQVHQIVMNLCTNAFHAMEKSGGVLAVGLFPTANPALTPGTAQLAPGEHVELTVSDTGTGIGADIIDRIFDPYFTTKEIGRGTGLGLSVTHGIIRSYGGAVTVESTPGQGSTFHVYFPVIQEETVMPEVYQEAPQGRGRILLVDDEELLVGMGRHMLERLGYTVTARRSSIEALQTFLNDPHQFDLVITDQTMPGMTGFDLSHRLLQVRPELPIILCTGFSHIVDEEAAKAIGIREFAFKPLTQSSIGQLVRKLLAGGGEPAAMEPCRGICGAGR
jgi:signal transduction histidine kinase/ActR/RegA family two-component response regulator